MSYPTCVRGDSRDRMAAGSGNIPNALYKGQVVTTCGVGVTLLCGSRDGDTAELSGFKSTVATSICFVGHLLFITNR